MTARRLNSLLKRKTLVTGHYGSGKTEFSISLALLLAEMKSNSAAEQSLCDINYLLSLIDLDIVNPYFRSRERRELLENAGISVYGSAYDTEVTAELPALGATIRTPLENTSCKVIIDTGGNDTGALILNQFSKYFTKEDTAVFAVVNTNRPDTSCADNIIEHITAIEETTNLNVDGLINNTHLLRETTVDDIITGNKLCNEVCKQTGKFLLCNCYPKEIINPDELTGSLDDLLPLGLYMRPSWLDK